MIKLCYLDYGSIQIAMLILYIVFLIAMIFVTRAIFSIPAIVKNLKVQTKLLSEMAKAQGIDPTVIEGIKKEANYKE